MQGTRIESSRPLQWLFVNKLAELSLSIGNSAKKLSLKLQFSLVVDAARIDNGVKSSGSHSAAKFDTQNFCIPKLNPKNVKKSLN